MPGLGRAFGVPGGRARIWTRCLRRLSSTRRCSTAPRPAGSRSPRSTSRPRRRSTRPCAASPRRARTAFVQITVGGARYLSGPARDAAAGARALAALARELAAPLPVAIALHTDHCPPEHVDAFLRPLLAASAERVARGEPALFASHMFDGSTLPLEDNLRNCAELLEQCRAMDVVLEVECGVVGGEEDGIGGEGTPTERLYTTPEDLLRVAEALGTGERGRYLLAATFGNVHGLAAPEQVRLRPEILAQGQEALARAHPGARFDYVFHGSSGSAPEQVREA